MEISLCIPSENKNLPGQEKKMHISKYPIHDSIYESELARLFAVATHDLFGR